VDLQIAADNRGEKFGISGNNRAFAAGVVKWQWFTLQKENVAETAGIRKSWKTNQGEER